MSSADYAHALRKLLPTGKAWEFITASGSFVWDSLIASLSEEPQRLEDDAYGLLNKVIPDNASTDLDFWEEIVGIASEDLTDAERLARIRAILFGPPDVTQPSLEIAAQRMAGDAGVKLFHRAYPPAAAGAMNVGDSLAVGTWDFTWLMELRANILNTDPDGFDNWTGLTAVSLAAQQSPVTLDATAAEATVPVTGATMEITDTADNDTVYWSIWVYPVADVNVLDLGLVRRSGSTSVLNFTDLEGGRWYKLTYQGSLGAGATQPKLYLGADAPAACYLSWAVAGVVNTALEARLLPLFPIHTRGHFAVQGEYETLLSHEDQLEVSY